MRLLDSFSVRVWGAALVVGLVACVLGWHLRWQTHLAGQSQARTILALEVVPLLVGAICLLAIRQRAAWIALSSPRRLELHYAGWALVASTPAAMLPVVTIGLLHLISPWWLPGRNSLEPLDMVPLSVQLPWFFAWSLVATLAICLGVGLAGEGLLGRGVGAMVAVLAYVAIVVLQSTGRGRFLAGAPGVDVHVSPLTWVVAVACLGAGAAVFGVARAGARGLLARA